MHAMAAPAAARPTLLAQRVHQINDIYRRAAVPLGVIGLPERLLLIRSTSAVS